MFTKSALPMSRGSLSWVECSPGTGRASRHSGSTWSYTGSCSDGSLGTLFPTWANYHSQFVPDAAECGDHDVWLRHAVALAERDAQERHDHAGRRYLHRGQRRQPPEPHASAVGDGEQLRG